MIDNNKYVLLFAGILEQMAADGYSYEEVEDVFYTAVDETALFGDDFDDYDDEDFDEYDV